MMMMLIAIILMAYCFPTVSLIIFVLWLILLAFECFCDESSIRATVISEQDKIEVSKQFIKKVWKP